LRDGSRDIASDSFCNFVITGYFQDSVRFGDTTLTCIGGNDIFLAKYNNDGNVVWVVQAGGQGDDAGLSIAIDG